MKSPMPLALSALLFCSTASAQEDDPTPTITNWVTPTVALPKPYDSLSIYVTADSAGSCQASLGVYSSNSCWAQSTVYPTTTTLAFPVDCLGCSKLATSVRYGHCPLGGHHTSTPETTVTTPRTRWSFVCAPTPAPTA